MERNCTLPKFVLMEIIKEVIVTENDLFKLPSIIFNIGSCNKAMYELVKSDGKSFFFIQRETKEKYSIFIQQIKKKFKIYFQLFGRLHWRGWYINIKSANFQKILLQ